MNQYLLLIHGDTPSRPTAEEWTRFFTAAKDSGMFRGGSEIGARTMLGRQPTSSSLPLTGYMRFDTDDKPRLLQLLAQHPVVVHGGTVELCELPKS
jgi:hypothetical protein